MRQVNIYEAKTQLSLLIASGEEIIITLYGEPIESLVPLRPPVQQRAPSSARGKFEVPQPPPLAVVVDF